ncbi:hypothetical protein BH18ACI5_BH18ACI5_01960 [soil metagenome]
MRGEQRSRLALSAAAFLFVMSAAGVGARPAMGSFEITYVNAQDDPRKKSSN